MITDDPMTDARSYNDDVRVFDRWRALDPRAKRLSLEAAALTLLTVVRVKLEGAPRLLRRSAFQGDAAASADDVRPLAAAVDRASRYIPGTTCLSRALALQSMLRRRGIAADVRLGVRKESGALLAHAWVECQGIVLGGATPGDPYVALR